MHLSEQLLYSTVRLEVDTERGRSVGTAFFFTFLKEGDAGVPALITNKHVLDGGRTVRFLSHVANADRQPTGRFRLIEIAIAARVDHPNPTVDLCALLVGSVITHCADEGEPLFYTALDHSNIVDPEDDPHTKAIEELVMIGYPSGTWDHVNNRPIVRRGLTATDFRLRYQGKPEFLIDAACFPGSSGSPVFLYDPRALMPRPNVLVGTRFRFIGVLYAGPTLNEGGQLGFVPIPTQAGDMNQTRTMIHLGLVVMATELLEIDRVIRELREHAVGDDVDRRSVPPVDGSIQGVTDKP